MPLRPGLLNEIRQILGPSLVPSLNSASAASDIYEAYIFSLICQAATAEGASVCFQSRLQPAPTTFIFRTSPGHIQSTRHDYGYAVIDFPNKPLLEAHLGIRVAGGSKVLHECDVSVLFHDEAELCRTSPNNIAPRASKMLLAVEAKFYDTSVDLYLGRAFLGLAMDVGAHKPFLVINRESASIEKLLSHKQKKWEHNIQPQNSVDVTRLHNAFQTVFKDFKAKY